MANFISTIFSKKETKDNTKLVLQAQLCVQNAILDKHLIALAVHKGRLEDLDSLLSLTTSIGELKIAVHEELNLISQYIECYKTLKGQEFYIKLQHNIEVSNDFEIYPFILVTLVQNAIIHGYTTMEKYPIRIKINEIGKTLKIEVSNRVNHYIANQEDTELINNFKARLALLYPDSHSLIINSNSNLFKATLLLN